MTLGKYALALLALSALAAAQATGAGANPMDATRKQLNTATAPQRNAAAAALEAASGAQKPAAPPSQAVAGKSAPAAGAPKTNPMAPKPASASAKPATAKQAPAPEMARKGGNKRDPFVSPVMRAAGKGPAIACNTGKRCLLISEMSLRGIVKSASGMIAVVENPAHKTYFLRVNDPVFNGMVVKITGEAVIFRESVTDNLGQQSTREVVKSVNPPPAA